MRRPLSVLTAVLTLLAAPVSAADTTRLIVPYAAAGMVRHARSDCIPGGAETGFCLLGPAIKKYGIKGE